jgi:hypothetical protein
MAQFGPSIQTATISTGNVRTTIDTYNGSSFGSYPEPYGAKNPLGAAYYDNPTSTANSYGTGTKYRYVRYNSASNPTPTGVTGPFPVYWTDATFTTVTPVVSEAIFNGPNAIAGLAMPNLTSLSQYTAAQLATALNGNYIWIAVGGYVSGIWAPASTAVGDQLIGVAASTFNLARVAAGTAPTSRCVAYATTAVATNLCNGLLVLES